MRSMQRCSLAAQLLVLAGCSVLPDAVTVSPGYSNSLGSIDPDAHFGVAVSLTWTLSPTLRAAAWNTAQLNERLLGIENALRDHD